MKDNFEKEVLGGLFENQVEKFEGYLNAIEHLHKIFKEMNFICVDDNHDGFCPECEQMLKCKVYKEIKDEWEKVYS
jgi:hypothetical protein